MPWVKRKNPVQEPKEYYSARCIFGKFKLTAKIVGYLWENNAPQFVTGVSAAWHKTRLIVLQSGPEKLGEWIFGKRNICGLTVLWSNGTME